MLLAMALVNLPLQWWLLPHNCLEQCKPLYAYQRSQLLLDCAKILEGLGKGIFQMAVASLLLAADTRISQKPTRHSSQKTFAVGQMSVFALG